MYSRLYFESIVCTLHTSHDRAPLCCYLVAQTDFSSLVSNQFHSDFTRISRAKFAASESYIIAIELYIVAKQPCNIIKADKKEIADQKK